MSDFKAKMHQIRFRLGLCPRPRWGSLQRSPIPPSLLLREGREGGRGKGRGGGRGVKGKGRKKGEREGKGRDPPAVHPPLLKNPGYGPDPRPNGSRNHNLGPRVPPMKK